jgi:hypothetical protein
MLLVCTSAPIGTPHQHKRYVPPAAVVSTVVVALPGVVLVLLLSTNVEVKIVPGGKTSTGFGTPHVSKIDTHEPAYIW